MRFDRRMSFELWKALGPKLSTRINATAWWLGDWLTFGQAMYGRRYRDAIAMTGLDYQTLRNYAVVARRFDLSRRRYNLSFQHHAELCALTDAEQDQWLDLAAANGWSKQQLRRQVREASPMRSPEPRRLLRLEIAAHREARWRTAAERTASSSLQAWALNTLDAAADAALSKGGSQA
jgi:hypothetical protein